MQKFTDRVTLLPASVTLQVKHEQITKLEKIISKAKIWQIAKELDVFWVVIPWFCRYCDQIFLFGAKIELPWVGELSLAERLQGATVTLAPG